MQNILAIDDKPEYLEPLAGLLNRHNFAVDTLTNPFQALQQFQSKQYHCVLLDVKMPGKSGLEVLDELLRENPTVPVIMISGESTIPIAVKAVKTGAFDFVEKNGSFQNILDAIEKAMARLQQLGISDDVSTCQIPGIIGNSPVIQSLCRRIRHVTMTNVRVLITGESGTGKELVAHAIHKLSGRARKPFVTINCAAIPRDLFESELFGHRKGSFTGAVKDQLGKFLEADGGTIFLDEIGEMDMALQAKLLRVLQEGEIEPIGGGRPQPVDVRVLAASNRDLEAAVADGNFREDLYYRLSVVRLNAPPLRDRIGDVPLIAQYFLHEYARKYGRNAMQFSPAAVATLQQQRWQGNVRQLQNVIENAAIFSPTTTVDAETIQEILADANPLNAPEPEPATLKQATDSFERSYVLQQLEANDWKIQQTADALGINRSALFKKMRRLGIRK